VDDVVKKCLVNAAEVISEYCIKNQCCVGCPFGGEDCSCEKIFKVKPIYWDLGGRDK